MKNIIIFGDSYGDPNYTTDNINFIDIRTWYDMLNSKYNVINHSLSGSGPHYSFKKYYEFITKEQNFDEYVCIFILSGEDRINFYGRTPDCGSSINWNDNRSYLVDEKDKFFYENFKSEIDFFYLTMQEEIQWFNCKNISFLYVQSILLNLKTIIFLTSASLPSGNSFFNQLNFSNFYIFDTILNHISEMEFNDIETLKENAHYAFNDYRKNHFSQENHEIFYNNIEKLIDNDHELSAFKTHLNPSNYYGEVIFDEHLESDKFIYD